MPAEEETTEGSHCAITGAESRVLLLSIPELRQVGQQQLSPKIVLSAGLHRRPARKQRETSFLLL